MKTEPLPNGTLVNYHGSITEYHGDYVIESSVPVGEHRPDLKARLSEEQLTGYYPDGVCYFLWPVGVEKKFGNRDLSLNSVRRGSITVIPSEDGPDPESTED